MGVKDQVQHFPALSGTVPNTVSRNLKVGERAFGEVVYQSGKPVPDCDMTAAAAVGAQIRRVLRGQTTPSGWLKRAGKHDSYTDYTVVNAPVALVVPGPGVSYPVGSIDGVGILTNALVLSRLEALVAGFPVTVEYANTCVDGYNIVTFSPARVYDGTAGSIKRTDFAFLEVWQALVAPAVRATGTVEVVDATALLDGDTITIDGVVLTGRLVGPLLVDEFLIDAASETNTADNIAAAINDPTNSFLVTVKAAVWIPGTVTITSQLPGAIGNLISLATSNVNLSPSWAFLTGGADRENHPGAPASEYQGQVFCHGNTQSTYPVWLDDEMLDPTLDFESSQRVQVQYRIRVTGTPEGVNFKTHPDGFSQVAGDGVTPTVLAQGGAAAPDADYPFVRADGTGTWGLSDAGAYGYQDDGLWVAGDGSDTSAQALHSVDGFVYAIPLCFVFRRNNASDAAPGIQGFDPVNNTNGAPEHTHAGYVGVLGAIPAGESDRPDGRFSDVIVEDDILDLRRHVSHTGFDYASELQYQMHSLLDGTNRTWAIDTASKEHLGMGSGDVSTRFLVCNEIGRDPALGGPPGPGQDGLADIGMFVRNFDHIARRFGDQSVLERVVFAFYPDDRSVGPVAPPGQINPGKYVVKAGGSVASLWTEGDILTLDLNAFNATTLGGIFDGQTGGGSSDGGTLADPSIGAFLPPGAVITDVLTLTHDDGNSAVAADRRAIPTLIAGVGTRFLEITLDANNEQFDLGGLGVPRDAVAPTGGPGGSPRRIFVEVEIAYPIGVGTTDTPDETLTPSAAVYDGVSLPGVGPGPMLQFLGAPPYDSDAPLSPTFRAGYREIGLEYRANGTDAHSPAPVVVTIAENLVSEDPFTIITPRRIGEVVSVTDNLTALPVLVDPNLTEYGASTRKIVLGPGGLSAPQASVSIEYVAQDPIPNYGVSGANYQVGVYFRANAPQTAGVIEGDITEAGGGGGTVPTTLHVEPLLMSSKVWTGQAGTGSTDLASPYARPLTQIATNDDPAVVREWYFCATASVSVQDFNAPTGLLALHPFVQADAQNILEFGGPGVDVPRKDAEFRAYYPVVADTTYRPTVIAQTLNGIVRHKVFTPFLARIVEDVPNASGSQGGILFRRGELALVVLSRFAALDEDNTVRFLDVDNTTCAALYRTRNLLLVAGD